MKLHLVGGFLGSGKTTAIIGAARHMMAQGLRVGVVTNDQGRYLVDTAFFRAADLPAVEVTGGCFCCNYDDLGARLSQLQDTARPDVIFAESVGSCADIVATVVKPFLELDAGRFTLSSFSVFADIRLLRRRLLAQPMPFGDDVVYIFDKQIEEANLLILNKADALAPDQAEATLRLAQDRFPGKRIRRQDSLQPGQVAAWADLLQSGAVAPPRAAVDIDYARYGAGEAELAWLDEEVAFTTPPGRGAETVRALIGGLARALRERGLAVGHVKFLVRADGREAKISLPTLFDDGWQSDVPPVEGTGARIVVNARVEVPAEELRAIVASAIRDAAALTGATFAESELSVFHPGFPRPTHRLA
jgi:Ni2+-binding GTPase involved in maturation of urease and hydrogenase